MITAGTRDEVEEGMTVNVGLTEVMHPLTGLLLASIPIATFKVVQTTETFSMCEFIYAYEKDAMQMAVVESSEVEVVGERWGLLDN